MRRKPRPAPGPKPLPPAPLDWLADHFAKVITALAGGIGAITAIYGTLVAPETDLLQLLALTLALLGLTVLGLGLHLLTYRRRGQAGGKRETRSYRYSEEQRRSARRQWLPAGGIALALAGAALVAGQRLTPELAAAAVSPEDNEVLLLTGSRFGASPDDVRVQVGDRELVPLRISADRIEVAMPDKFRMGEIAVRRGPRRSGSLYFSLPGIVYDAAVIRLIAPTEGGIGALTNLIEPFPGFPYYSQTSDHPSQWPPRVWKDRTALHTRIEQELAHPAVAAELERWLAANPPSVRAVGGGIDEPLQRFLRLRFALAEQNNDFARLGTLVGPATADALRRLEAQRRELQQNLPNRLLMLRVQNQLNTDAENFTVQFKVGGAVYDVTLNAEGEKARSLEWSPQRLTVEIPRLRPNDIADVQIWYYRLPLADRVFPSAMDLEWEKTEGVVIDNLGISNARVRRSPRLLADFQSYQRYAVDPVRSSPTFGRLPTPPAPEPASPAAPARPATTKAAPPPVGPEPAPVERAATPALTGAQVTLVHIGVSGGYARKDDANQAQLRIAQALTDFSTALARAVDDAGGAWFFDRTTPVTHAFNRFAGEFLMDGGMLALIASDRAIDVTRLPGWTALDQAGAAETEAVPAARATYEVVLHFISDPTDSRSDSKRLLTRALPLDRIFDLAKARAGERNVIAAEFADLLRFARERLQRRYGAPFTLDDVNNATDPFYLVVRHRTVSENFYLPAAWMPLAETPAPRAASDAELRRLLSRLYDYGSNSRELTAAEFDAIFGP